MARVCVFGDSIAWGRWDPAGGGWVGRLFEAGCNRTDLSQSSGGTFTAVYNCGISGDRLADVSARLDVEARARQPAAVVLAIGINDVPHDDYAGTTPADFRRGFVELIDRASSYADDMVIVTPTNVDESRSEHDYRNADIAELSEATEGCAREAAIEVVNVFGLMTPADLEPDGLHPGANGHEKLFRAIAPIVFALASLNE